MPILRRIWPTVCLNYKDSYHLNFKTSANGIKEKIEILYFGILLFLTNIRFLIYNISDDDDDNNIPFTNLLNFCLN
jgi:hypothetical protein